MTDAAFKFNAEPRRNPGTPISRRPIGRPDLSMFADLLEELTGEVEDAEPVAPPGLSKQMRLSEFFESWFVPTVLIGEHEDSQATITLYRNAIAWWVKLTGDPPIQDIDQQLVSVFSMQLKTAEYSRGPGKVQRSLAGYTVAKHALNIRTIIRRAGIPKYENDERTFAELIETRLRVRVQSPRKNVKPSFSLEEVRSIFAATPKMESPESPGISAGLWWRLFLSVLFYSGLRTGTVLKLRWEHVDRGWLKVPGSIVRKTGKAIDRALHGQVQLLLAQIHGHSELLLPLPHCYRHLHDLHKRLLELAGIPVERRLSMHVWRRTFGSQMASLGISHAMRISQVALDHANSRTTAQHYVDFVNELIPRLPVTWTGETDNRQMRLF